MFFVFALIFTQKPTYAYKLSKKTIIPDVSFEVATRQNGMESVDNGIYIFSIRCGLGDCSILKLSLNECLPDSDGEKGFILSFDRYSNKTQWLKVVSATKDSMEMEIYQFTHKNHPAHINIKFIPKIPFSTELISFKATGFFDRNLRPLSKPNVSYVPIIGSSHLEKIDCPLKVPGFNQE